MTFSFLKSEYDFNSDDIYMEIKTDFEFIKINMTNHTNYILERNELIRFISHEFEEEEYERSDYSIHGVYFLPSHKEKEFCEYLKEEVFVQAFEEYYTSDMKKSFESIEVIESVPVTIQHKDRQKYGTSFYGIEEDVEFVTLIQTAKEILELNAMKNYKIAVGVISGQLGLLERGQKLRTENPQSKHYNFWKFCESKTEKSFSDVGKGFKIVS